MRIDSALKCVRCGDEIDEGRVCNDCFEARGAEYMVPRRDQSTEHDDDPRLYKSYIGGVAEYGLSKSVEKLRRRQLWAVERDRESKMLDGRNHDGSRTRFCHVCQVSLPITGRCDDCD